MTLNHIPSTPRNFQWLRELVTKPCCNDSKIFLSSALKTFALSLMTVELLRLYGSKIKKLPKETDLKEATEFVGAWTSQNFQKLRNHMEWGLQTGCKVLQAAERGVTRLKVQDGAHSLQSWIADRRSQSGSALRVFQSISFIGCSESSSRLTKHLSKNKPKQTNNFCLNKC